MKNSLADKRRIALQSFITDVIEGQMKESLFWWCEKAQISDGGPRAFLNKKTNSLREDTYHKLANAIGMNVSVLLGETSPPKVLPINGYIGSGGMVYLYDKTKGNINYVSAPQNSDADELQVLEVVGDSMYPAFEEGDCVFYALRDTFIEEECFKRQCVVQLENGGIMVRVIISGTEPGTYSLLSYNAPAIQNVKIKWASPITNIDKRLNLKKK